MISDIDNKVSYTGDGTDSALTVNFIFWDSTDLVVTKRVTATGAETELTENTHYTVSGGSGSTGTITPVDGATDFASTVSWTISRSVPRTQDTDLTENDAFSSASVETSLDKGAVRDQDIEEQLDRSLHYPVTDSTSLSSELPNSVDRASSYLGFDSDGEPVALSAPTDTALTTTYTETLLDDGTAAAARATLGFSAQYVNSITVTAANAAANTIDVTIWPYDADGNVITTPTLLFVWLSDDPSGVGGSAHTHSTGPAFTNGEEITEMIANDAWLVLYTVAAPVVLRLIDTANENVTINASVGAVRGYDTTVAGDWS